MADKPKRKAKSVLGTLPAKRPERLGAPRAKPSAKRRATAKPRPIRPAAPPLRPRRAAKPPPKPLGPPKGTELITTTIRAAGELAQIGLTVGGQVLRRAVDRIPRP
jgi:hypothetical protein